MVLAAITGFVATGCLKSVETGKQDPLSYVYLMHVAPKAPSVEVYFGTTKVSDPIAAGAISNSYSAVAADYFDVTFKKASSDSVVAQIPALNYDSAGIYTLLLYNDPSGQGKAVRIKDDLSYVTLDKAYYRFFQMVPNLGQVDLYIDGAKQQERREPADNVYSDFYNQFTPYTYGYHTIQIKATANDSLIAQAIDVSMLQGNAYTIVLKGLVGGGSNYTPSITVARAIY
ncbi:MAG: DUF4397 domain-containing protein [Chitinophagaceae bacterium]